MWLSSPGRPSRQVVLPALLITCVIFGLIGLIQLIPEGPLKRIVATIFHVLVGIFVVVMLLLAVNARVRRADGEAWDLRKRDD
jgi:uncharacterized membrane protein required for colicin V production